MYSDALFSYKQNNQIRFHIMHLVGDRPINKFITVTFARSVYGPLRRKHVEDARRMVQAYSKKLSDSVYGRERGRRRNRITFIAWPEDKDKSGMNVPLHYHILCAFPDDTKTSLNELTQNYWHNACTKSPHRCIPDIDIRDSYDVSGAALYNTKNIVQDFTIEYMVVVGFEDFQG